MSKISNLSKEDLKTLYHQYAKQNGYEETPPTIMEFLSDDYYLGQSFNNGKGLYQYWKNLLVDVYPTPFFEHNNKMMAIFGGGTGIGKCLAGEQEVEVYMSEEDIKKFGLEEYIV